MSSYAWCISNNLYNQRADWSALGSACSRIWTICSGASSDITCELSSKDETASEALRALFFRIFYALWRGFSLPSACVSSRLCWFAPSLRTTECVVCEWYICTSAARIKSLEKAGRICTTRTRRTLYSFASCKISPPRWTWRHSMPVYSHRIMAHNLRYKHDDDSLKVHAYLNAEVSKFILIVSQTSPNEAFPTLRAIHLLRFEVTISLDLIQLNRTIWCLS